VVSAAIQPAGVPASIVELVALRALTRCLSDHVLAGCRAVLARRKFARLDQQHVARLLGLLAAEAELVTPARRVAVSRDEPDNRVLECAEAAGAACLVTGNTKHFPKRHRGTHIVNPREYLDIILVRRQPIAGTAE